MPKEGDERAFKVFATQWLAWNEPADPVNSIVTSIDGLTDPPDRSQRYAPDEKANLPPNQEHFAIFRDGGRGARICKDTQRIGIEIGKSFDIDKVDPAVKKALERVPQGAQQLMKWKVPSLARVVNGWSMNTDTMGVYGNYYLKRAIVTQLGLGANLPEDAIYPMNLGDESGKPLDGANKYTIHFDKDAIPPANAFWSITLYDQEGYQVANSLNRFAVSNWMPFTYNPDGSLDLYFQNESPGADKEANWLPAPKGPFNLCMRLYAPKSEALTGKWNPPPVMRVQEVPPLATQ